ncbi:MAG: cysteine desulfurase family protein [Planctomycetota bacterium]|jgi:cysteine desulfurase
MDIYLDHNATTPVRPEVADAMDDVVRRLHGNPSSVHADGAAAKAAIERARGCVASLLGAAASDVLFTGGATEANNTALFGLLRTQSERRRHIVTTTVEHPSVEEPLRRLEGEGWRVTRIGVDEDGCVDPDEVGDAITPDTALVSLIWANNETGSLQPVGEIAHIAREKGVLVHSDATQAIGKIPVDLRQVPLNLLSLSAHKFNGPKGVGSLVVRGGLGFDPLLCGGPQEGRRRGGTENVAGIVGLGVACELAESELVDRMSRYARLRARLWEGIQAKVPGVRRNGSAVHVLPNTLNVEFEGTAGELLLQALDLEGVAVSSGAACASGSIEPSHVLVAMGRSTAAARGSLRLSVGHGVDGNQVDRVLTLLPDLVERARRAEAP